MEVKILCACGSKFAFDVEPVNGRMPVEIQCPQCGTDVTGKANQIIAGNLSAQAPVPVAAPAKIGLRVSGAAPLATPVARPAQAAPAEGEVEAVMCPKHLRTVATSNCFVCQKPICPECMALFGYLCSVQCKYRAEQNGIQVPKYQFQKAAVENQYWQKVARISAAIVVFILFIVGFAFWYEFSGSHPKQFYSLKYHPEKAPMHAEFLGPDEMLMVFADRLEVHDLKKKKELWSTALTDKAGEPSAGEDDQYDYYRSDLSVHPTKDAIWMTVGKRLQSFDRKTGAKKQAVELPGDVTRVRVDDGGLHVFTHDKSRKGAITTVDTVSGAAKTQEIVLGKTEQRFVAAEMPEGIPATAAFLLDRELASDEDRKNLMNTVYSRFISAGANTVEMQVRMVQENVVMKSAMKEKGPSNLNAGTSAASPVGVVAEEIFNDLKRDKTGGLKKVDESRYSVTIRRMLKEEIAPFTIEVVGPPGLIPLKTIDVLVAGTNVVVLDKQNKKLFEAKLPYPVSEELSMLAGENPFVETRDSLYLFDQGVLTAFNLPGGDVRWRMTSVGITKIQADEAGDLYVNSTTGSPEDIQYSEQIKFDDAPKPILLKVEGKTGKVLWRSPNLGACELSGKYVYALSMQSGGIGLARGLGEALGSSIDDSSHFRIFRINDSSGRRLWDYYNSGAPEQVDFEGKKILLRFGNEVRVLKHMSL